MHLPKVAQPKGEETEQETLRRERKELRKEGRAAIKVRQRWKSSPSRTQLTGRAGEQFAQEAMIWTNEYTGFCNYNTTSG